jgi:hypothetical protein
MMGEVKSMRKDVVEGFVMAGVAVLIAIIGSVLYCFFGIGCPGPEDDQLRQVSGSESDVGMHEIEPDGNPHSVPAVERVVEA